MYRLVVDETKAVANVEMASHQSSNLVYDFTRLIDGLPVFRDGLEVSWD